MPRVNEQEIATSIETNRKLAARTLERNRKIQERTEAVVGWSVDQEPLEAMDFSEETTFDEARKNQTALENNVAVLIHGLDQVTSSFGDEFKTMTESTVGERVMGFLSKRKAEAMRSERVRNTDLTSNLERLISKSNSLSVLLREGREQTEEVRNALAADFPKIREQIAVTARKRMEIEASIVDLETRRGDIEHRMKDVTDDVQKRELETQYAKLATELNQANGKRQSLTATEQSLERYSNQYQNHLQTLDTQLAGQETLIDKLEVDSEKRSFLYAALTQSIKLNAQQDVAHRVNEIGQATDAFAERLMANNKQASENKMISMFESHKEWMAKTEEISARNADSDAKFKERFSGVIEDMDNRTQFVQRA
jgi:hypothetical protein